MPMLLWDSSGLLKRYALETGSATVDALFAAVPLSQMVTTILAYVETFSVLLRKRNGGIISPATFTRASSLLRAEIAYNPDVQILSVDDAAMYAAIGYMTVHNLNATDSAMLHLFLEYVHSLPPGSPSAVLIAADQRFLRAASAEGLKVLNPEILAPADVPAFLTTV